MEQKEDIIVNNKAYHDYFIEDKYQAGIVLQGWEVKSIRAHGIQINDGYIHIKDGEVFIIGCQVQPLKSSCNHIDTDKDRTKKLLLTKHEIQRLVGKVTQKGFTLVPLRIYFNSGKVKCEIGLAKGKKEYDKRHTLKENEIKREIARNLKNKT